MEHNSTTPASPTPATNVRYGILGILCVGATVAYFSRNILGVAASDIRAELDLSVEQMGVIMGSFFYLYSAMQIPGGLVGERFGIRQALLTYALVWGVATMALGVTAGYVSLLLTYVVVGVAQGGLFPCSVIAFSRWLPTARHGLAGGTLTSFMSIGGAIATALTGVLLGYTSWRWICAAFGLPALVWGLFFFWWFRNHPREHAGVNDAELAIIRGERSTDSQGVNEVEGGDGANPAARGDRSLTVGAGRAWRIVLTSWAMWMVAGQQFFRAAGYIFFATWFPTYLKETRGVTTAASGFLTMAPLLSVVVGATLGGILADGIWTRTGSRVLSRNGVGIVSTSACALACYLAYRSDSTATVTLWLSVGGLFQAMASPAAIAVALDVGGRQVSKVYSLMNTCGNLGAAVCPWAVARFVTVTGERWELVPLFFVFVFMSSVLCWIFLNPNRHIVPESTDAMETRA